MTKADIVEQIAAKTGLTKTDTALVVEGVLESLKEALISGETVEIRGFGTFKIKKRAARRARNPRTGETMTGIVKHGLFPQPLLDLYHCVLAFLKD